jgi:hypothetical protein
MALLVDVLRSLAESGRIHRGGGLSPLEISLVVLCGGGSLFFLSFHLNRWK